jgi:hypothetical protein
MPCEDSTSVRSYPDSARLPWQSAGFLLLLRLWLWLWLWLWQLSAHHGRRFQWWPGRRLGPRTQTSTHAVMIANANSDTREGPLQ